MLFLKELIGEVEVLFVWEGIPLLEMTAGQNVPLLLQPNKC